LEGRGWGAWPKAWGALTPLSLKKALLVGREKELDLAQPWTSTWKVRGDLG